MKYVKIANEESNGRKTKFCLLIPDYGVTDDDLKVYKVEPTVLISLLAREYRFMYYVKVLYQKFNKDKLCSYLGIQDWQLTKIYNNSIKYQERELLDNLVELCNIDMNIKKGIWDKDIALINFILNACS